MYILLIDYIILLSIELYRKFCSLSLFKYFNILYLIKYQTRDVLIV